MLSIKMCFDCFKKLVYGQMGFLKLIFQLLCGIETNTFYVTLSFPGHKSWLNTSMCLYDGDLYYG